MYDCMHGRSCRRRRSCSTNCRQLKRAGRIPNYTDILYHKTSRPRSPLWWYAILPLLASYGNVQLGDSKTTIINNNNFYCLKAHVIHYILQTRPYAVSDLLDHLTKDQTIQKMRRHVREHGGYISPPGHACKRLMRQASDYDYLLIVPGNDSQAAP